MQEAPHGLRGLRRWHGTTTFACHYQGQLRVGNFDATESSVLVTKDGSNRNVVLMGKVAPLQVLRESRALIASELKSKKQ